MVDWRRRVERGWYEGSGWLTPLRPLGWLVGRVAGRRLRRFRRRAERPPVPVLVVGNVAVGGTGKTPLVIALARRARERGLNPVVISRGYGGRADAYPRVVALHDDPREVGDEPLLIARRAAVPVVLDPQRDRALWRAVTEFQPDLVISDDGLQHYALPRSSEVVVIDARRGLGNQRCLPAGPLREPASRLSQVDFLVANGGAWPGATTMHLVPGDLVRLRDGETPTENALLAVARGHLASYKLPRRFVFVDEIVRSPSGKADYRWAKARALEEGDPLSSRARR